MSEPKIPPKGVAVTLSKNPITGEILDQIPLHSVEDVRRAIQQARDAQKEWRKFSVKERARRLRPAHEYLVAHAAEIAEIVSRDNGKVRVDALVSDVVNAVISMKYYCKYAPKLLKDKKLPSKNIMLLNKHSKLTRVPFGVVGIISPWNYPLSIPLHEITMGLLAGNAILFKAATETQLVGKTIEKIIRQADLPPGLFANVNLPGRLAGDAFLENGVDKLFFTGSVPVGKYLMRKASETLTPLSLELGGNDPLIICDDADPYRAASGALWAGFTNAGQTCGGVERIYVQKNIYDDFLAILKEKVEKFRVGYDTHFDVDMGALTTSYQIDVVKLHVEDALKKGARIFAQSAVPNDPKLHNFLPAMVLTDVNHDMLLMQEETFGPVVGVMKFETMEEAIALANDSVMGLSASVWSKDQKKAERVARQIQAGAVMINDHLMSHGMAETPWGGFKESGIGRTHGELGLHEMTEPQVIVFDRFSFAKKDMWWHPYSRELFDRLLGTIQLLYAKSIVERVKALGKVLRLVPRMFEK